MKFAWTSHRLSRALQGTSRVQARQKGRAWTANPLPNALQATSPVQANFINPLATAPRHVFALFVSPTLLLAHRRHSFALSVSPTLLLAHRPPLLCVNRDPLITTTPQKGLMQNAQVLFIIPSAPARCNSRSSHRCPAPSFRPAFAIAHSLRRGRAAATHLQGRRPCSVLGGRAGCKCVAAGTRGGAWRRGGMEIPRLRCAALGMTRGGRGCARNDRREGGAARGMTEGCGARNDREGRREE